MCFSIDFGELAVVVPGCSWRRFKGRDVVLLAATLAVYSGDCA